MSRATLFGSPAPQIIDPKRKAKLMIDARRAMHASALPQGVKRLTGNHVEIYGTLLWRFHRNKGGACYPAHETIARWVGVGVSTVREALRRLEGIGLINWHHRIRRVEVPTTDPRSPHPLRRRIIRTSNAYKFARPKGGVRRALTAKASIVRKQREPRNALKQFNPIGQQRNKNDFLPITNWLNERIAKAIQGRHDPPPELVK
jgi:hypothetical protein